MGYWSGVTEYSTAVLAVPFPKGEEFCFHCPLHNDYRGMCMASGELITDVRKRGKYCKLRFEEDMNGQLLGDL